ncbi:hypothetical protein [Chitinophaga polysaccharea]|uniref:hypothetical protein n=1 Tax=Chitinophaga polysaccharea TaxID=1293035 RepID=UPI00115C1EA8|nr:hypothetical protein [Chitinophaga polysaccharea]
MFAFVILVFSCKKEGNDSGDSPAIQPGDSVVLYPEKAHVEGALPFDIKLVRAMDPKRIPLPPPQMGFRNEYEDRSKAYTREIVAENWTIDGKWFTFKSILTFPYVSNPELIKSAYLTLHSHFSPGGRQ